VVAGRIAAARQRQRARWAETGSGGRLQARALRSACAMDAVTEGRAIVLAEREGLSGRGMDRLLRVARTIADLAGDVAVQPPHLDEAARFRSPVDRMAMWRAG
jgi:magnesium chelatase family protein